LKSLKNVFENDRRTPDDSYLSLLLSNADFMVFVVKVENEVIGGLTIYVLHGYYSIKPAAYIYDVGITPRFQGQGLGKALISHVCDFCKANGFEDAYVEAESDDVDAVNFYRKTNFAKELNAIHFTFAFNIEK
jgi:aminoglycoside 3-N-acetyltransferase I